MNSSDTGWHSPGTLFNPFQLKQDDPNKQSKWQDQSTGFPVMQLNAPNTQFPPKPFASPLSFSRRLEQPAFQLPVTPMAAFLERSEADRLRDPHQVGMLDKISQHDDSQQNFEWSTASSPSTNNNSMMFSISSTPSASPTSSIHSTPSHMRQHLRVKIPGMIGPPSLSNDLNYSHMHGGAQQFEMQPFSAAFDPNLDYLPAHGSRRGSDAASRHMYLTDMVTHTTSSSGASVGSSSTSGGPVKKHACHWPDCSKSFDKPSALKRHIRSHTGEKPFNCSWPGCTQSFSERGNLKRHQRCHTGEKPYHCDFQDCTDQFARRSHLLQHIRSKHDGSIQTRIDTSPNGTHATAHITGFNGYSKTMPVTPRRRRGSTSQQPKRKPAVKRRRGSLDEPYSADASNTLREAPVPYTRSRSSMDSSDRKSWIDQSSSDGDSSDGENDESMIASAQQYSTLQMSVDPPQSYQPIEEPWQQPSSALPLSPFGFPQTFPQFDQWSSLPSEFTFEM